MDGGGGRSVSITLLLFSPTSELFEEGGNSTCDASSRGTPVPPSPAPTAGTAATESGGPVDTPVVDVVSESVPSGS